jgi:hypothetical protein
MVGVFERIANAVIKQI